MRGDFFADQQCIKCGGAKVETAYVRCMQVVYGYFKYMWVFMCICAYVYVHVAEGILN